MDKHTNDHQNHIRLPHQDLSVPELALILSTLAKQYKMSLAVLVRKLDRVSGNVRHLQLLLKGDTKFEWTEEQNKLLLTNQGLLMRWKGKDAVEKRKIYLSWKNPKQ